MTCTYTKTDIKNQNEAVTYRWGRYPIPAVPDCFLDSETSSTSTVYYVDKQTRGWNVQQKVNGVYPHTLCYYKNNVRKSPINVLSTYVQGGLNCNGVPFGLEYVYDGWYLPGYATVDPENPALVSKARMDLANNMYAAQASLLVTIAEFGKTMDGIGSRVVSTAQAILAFKKGKIGKGLEILGFNDPKHAYTAARGYGYDRIISNTTLEWCYGWVPTMCDLQSIAEVAAERILNNPALKRHIKGRAESVWRHDPSYFSFTASKSGYGSHPFSGTKYNEQKHKVKMWAITRIDVPSYQKANQWGLLNPLEVAWELVPFSFVIDQAVSVGDYLRSLTAFQGITILDSGYGYERSGVDHYVIQADKGGNVSTGDVETVYYHRIPGVSVQPSLYDLTLELDGIFDRFGKNAALAHALIRR